MKLICAGFLRGGIVAAFYSIACCGSLPAATHYVWTNSPASSPPFTNWPTAAHTIQGALDSAVNGDEIVVTNGLYLLTASVMVTNEVTLKSVNGAAVTVVDGNGPATSNRCFSLLASNVTLEGFTVTNGNATDDDYGGGVLVYGTGVVIRSCRIVGNICADEGGGGLGLKADGTVVDDCLIAGNTADWGGGVTVTDGGALLQNSRIIGNRADSDEGGGVSFSTWGYTGTLHNCFISGNYAAQDGGGVDLGAGDLVMRQCTLSGNTARERGGGLSVNAENTTNVVVQNSIIYHNQALRDPNYHAAFWDDSVFRCDATCTTPLPDGIGNLAGPPGLLSPYDPHIVSNSICLHAGDDGYAVGALDIDGEPRTNGVRVDIGCDEFWAAAITGEIAAAIQLFPSNAVLNHPIEFTSLTEGRVSGYGWDFGDGQTTTDVCVVSHTYAATGHYDVVLSAWNNDRSDAATVRVQVVEGYTNYVAIGGGHVPPFTSWANAATTVQDAVDANAYAGGVTLVAAGTYDQGGAVYGPNNRVAITQPLTVMAADPDPSRTVLVGDSSDPTNRTRCAYLEEGARLIGFTLTGGAGLTTGSHWERDGGGALCYGGGVLSNCIVTGNASSQDGGGVALHYGGTALDCTVSGNQSTSYGGGILLLEGGRAAGCAVFSNDARWQGGGISCQGAGVIENCSVRDNHAGNHGGGASVRDGGAIRGCLITDNTATNGNRYGGGVYIENGGAVTDSMLRRNASYNGGGVYLKGDGAVASNCVVEQNWAGNYGGGIYFDKGGEAIHCDVRDNACGTYGGGLTLYEGGAIRDSRISGNIGAGYGGGAYFFNAGEVTRCVVSENTAGSNGGGVYVWSGGGVTNSVVQGNVSGRDGGGLYLYRGGVVENCTVTGNATGSGEEGGGVYGNSGGTLVNTIVYSNSATLGPNYAGSGLTWSNCCTTPNPGGGQVTDPPQFIHAAGAEVRLAAGSPCINAGTNRPWMVGGVDLAGGARIVEEVVDIGAYEVGPLTCGFTADPEQGVAPMTVQFTGYATGTNVADVSYQWDFTNDGMVDAEGVGLTTPQAVYPDEGLYTVRLAVGNAAGEVAVCIRTNAVTALATNVHYVSHAGSHQYPFTSWETAATDIQTAVNAAGAGARVVVADGVYPNVLQVTVDKPLTVHSENGPATTLIDGRGAARGFWLDSGAFISGFTITRGRGLAGASGGGGIYFDRGGTASNCVIVGCTTGGFRMNENGLLTDSVVRENTTTGDGGGGAIKLNGTVVRCEILDNYAATHGGGIHIDRDGTVRDSLIRGNEARAQFGGGLFLNYGGLAQRCVLLSNTCRWFGGGAYCYRGRMENCLVVDNEARDGDGGGIACPDAVAAIRNCTVVMNRAGDEGGGMYQGGLVNSIVYYNASTNAGDNGFGGTYAYSCTTPDPGGAGNTTDDPLLAGGGSYRLSSGSPCIDSGTGLPDITHDLDRVSRPLDGDHNGTPTIDMGCYEFVHGSADTDGDTMLDAWEVTRHLDPTNAVDATLDSDGDGAPNRDEHVADTDPWDRVSVFCISGMELGNSFAVTFACTNSRIYSLEEIPSLSTGQWAGVAGQTNLWGEVDGEMSLTDPGPDLRPAYRATVRIPGDMP